MIDRRAAQRGSTSRVLLVLVVVLASGLTAPLAGDAGIDGHWEGAIEIPGTPLAINVDFAADPDGSLTGDISIPAQGLRDLALTELSKDGQQVTFKIPGIPGDPSFSGTLSDDGQGIRGTFAQGGGSFPFELERAGSPAVQARAALAGFDEFVAQAIRDWRVSGAALAVVRGGEVVFAKGFGQRDVEGELPMTADTLFAIGSTTKAFTTTVLGMLVDEGLAEWDKPVREYIPEFRLYDPVTTELITPRDLVTHRSGLPRHDLVWYNNTQSTRQEIVGRLAYLEPSQPLRAKFQYNNLMYLTAGYLVERLTGGTWEEAVRTRLLEPLGMTRTNFSVHDSQEDDDFAQPYRENDEDELERIPFRVVDLAGPAGSINSSVNEMSRWVLFNLGRGKVGEQRLINTSTLVDIQSPHMTTGQTPERPEISQSTYGMGWSIDTYRGHRRVSHGGGIDGFVTSVMLFPNDDLGLVSFTNIASPLPSILSRHAADRVLDLDSIDWNGEALERRDKGEQAQEEAEKKKEATRVADTGPSHPLADYAGNYHHPGYGELEVTLEGVTLGIIYNNIATPLDHWHYDVFNGAETDGDSTFENTKLLFRGDVDGNIAAVESRLEMRVEPIVFRKHPDARLFDPEYLERFVGSYELAGQTLHIELSGETLMLTLPGQPRYTLVPTLSGRFELKEAAVITIGFEEDDDGNVTRAMVYQPGGVYEAARH